MQRNLIVLSTEREDTSDLSEIGYFQPPFYYEKSYLPKPCSVYLFYRSCGTMSQRFRSLLVTTVGYNENLILAALFTSVYARQSGSLVRVVRACNNLYHARRLSFRNEALPKKRKKEKEIAISSGRTQASRFRCLGRRWGGGA